MANVYIEDELEEIYNKATARAIARRKRLDYQRNVAAFVDFASNLVSTLAREKEKIPSSRAKVLKGAFNLDKSPIRDYKGAIVGNLFRERFTPSTRRGK